MSVISLKMETLLFTVVSQMQHIIVKNVVQNSALDIISK